MSLPIRIAGLAGFMIIMATAGAAPAQDQSRQTSPTTPQTPQAPAVEDAYITQQCTGSGRRRVCRYILRCDGNNVFIGAFNTYADAFLANTRRCPPRAAHNLVPGASDPGRSTRDPGAAQGGIRPQR